MSHDHETLKHKFKQFFRTSVPTPETIEFLKMFILPFARKHPKATVDDVLIQFFAVEDRRFFYAKATRDFKMPGGMYVAGNRPVRGIGNRRVRSGQAMLITVDRKEARARIETKIEGEYQNFQLEKYEFETIKDWIKLI